MNMIGVMSAFSSSTPARNHRRHTRKIRNTNAITFVMSRKMMLEIKRLAERVA